MPHRVTLVHITGWPLEEQIFLLPGEMILAAGLLKTAGIGVQVLDYGTPTALAQPAAAWQILQSEVNWWKRRRAFREFEATLKAWRDSAISEIIDWEPNDILFFAQGKTAWQQVRRMAETIHRYFPHIRVSGCGPGIPPEETLWKLWRPAEFLASRCKTLAGSTKWDMLESEAPACLYDSGKLSILPVVPERTVFHELQDIAEFRRRLSDNMLRFRPGTALWLEKSVGLKECFDLSEQIVRRHSAVLSVTVRPRMGMPPVVAGLLRNIGCLAVEIDALTGSQRLLEDVYGVDFSVRDTRELAHACLDAGMRVLLRFASPSCWDDRHTFAECERLSEQCGCAGVSVAGTDIPNPETAVSGIPRPADLESHLESAGIPTGLRGWHMIAAAAAGYGGRENRWLRHFRQSLREGDIDSLKSWIVICNRGLSRLAPAADTATGARLEAAAN